jgi:uncharacterized membrane protein
MSFFVPLALLAQNETAGEIESGLRTSWRLLDLPELWVIVLVLIPLLLLLSWISYARETLSTASRVVLASLRFLAIALLLVVIFRPVIVERNDEVKPAEVLILVDDSASMQRQDSYLGDTEARGSLRRFTAGEAGKTSRISLAAGALEKALLPLLEKGEYVPRLFRFAEDLTPLESTDSLAARGRGTHLGDTISQALSSNRGRHVTDVVILSDGRSNGGSPVLDAARAAGIEGIPVHTVVVGDTRPERNVFVELIDVPAEVLEGDEIAIMVRIAGRGTEGVEAVGVQFEELSRREDDPRLIDEKQATPGEGGERVVFLAPAESSSYDGGRRVRRFRISVDSVPEETLLDDNHIEFSVRVLPERIRVLYIDGYPRWEYRFLKELLKRSDQNISLQAFLLSATPDFLQEHSPGMEPLSRVPVEREELLENYDVVILGDINPDTISPDPARCEEFKASLVEFVQRGGGLLFQAGEYDNPRSFLDTPLAEVIPVVLDSTSGIPYQGDTTVEFRPTLENPAAPHQVVRLHPDDEVNRILWEDEQGLRGHYWYSTVSRAKPGSQVLLRHPTETGPYGRYPLLAVGYYPSGRTMFLGLDSTWMWRYRYGSRYHGRFWRNAIRWLALGRLKSGNRRFRLDSLRDDYGLDERISLEARVLDEDFRPSDRPVQPVRLEHPGGEITELSLLAVPGREGIYRSSVELERPGIYQAWIESEGERIAAADFEVRLPSRENDNPSPDPEAMRSVASLSGGVAVPLARIDELAAEFPGGEERREPISSKWRDAWDNWYTLLAVLALLSLEWILRKRFELV